MKTENAKERKREEKERKGKDTEMPSVYFKRFLHKAPPRYSAFAKVPQPNDTGQRIESYLHKNNRSAKKILESLEPISR